MATFARIRVLAIFGGENFTSGVVWILQKNKKKVNKKL